jgi:hypothetical protein
MKDIWKELNQTTNKRLGDRCMVEAHKSAQMHKSLCQRFLICVGDWQADKLDEPDDLFFHVHAKLI